MLKKLKNYLKSFWKYYLSRKLKLVLTIILTVVSLVILNNVLNEITSYILRNYRGEKEAYIIIQYLVNCNPGIFILFIKPIFIYIAGLIIIKKI
ncbi:hypothetical protein L6267_02935 [Candidatus Parcubacteria bacterium]|nr:hypothetical protein [Candidatus Parcubacteria bacterium]